MHKGKAMKKLEHGEDQELQLIKAVAQAWHAQVGNPRPTKESDARKNKFKLRPSRFKLEAISQAAKEEAGGNWDFAQSLWDSYEIVTLSKRLEASLALDHPMIRKRTRESKNSLRNLFSRASSKRFDANVPADEEDNSS